MKLRRYIFPGICAAVSAVLFIGLYLLLIFGMVRPPYLAGLLFLVPAVVFAFIAVHTYSDSISAIAANVVTAILIPIFVISSTLLLFFVSFDAAVNPCEDIRYYTRAYRTYVEDSAVASVFPERIPEDAEDAQFHYHAAFLQGGGEFSLKYTADASECDVISDKLKALAVWSGRLSEFDDWDERPSYFTVSSFHGTYDILNDAAVYLIEYRNAYDEEEDEYSWWNHGEYLIAAVKKESGEVLYSHCYW